MHSQSERKTLIAERVTLAAGTPEARRASIERQFERSCEKPDAWLDHAQSLVLGARAVSETLSALLDRHQHPAASRLPMLAYVRSLMLLWGFAFENLFKAIGAGRGLVHLQLNKAGTKRTLSFDWKQEGGGHSLTAHARHLEITLTQGEHELLKRIEAYSMWAGRYPFPRTADDYVYSRCRALLTWTTTDQGASTALFVKLAKEIPAQPQD